jgi:putative transposase
MIDQAEQLGQQLSVLRACQALGVPRSSLYRARQPQPVQTTRPKPDRALSEAEKAEVRAVLNSERFQDCPPRQVYATLLDEQTYLCHWRTMYRILKEHHESVRNGAIS